jgi:hypothetical protein
MGYNLRGKIITLEEFLSRIVDTQSVGKERNRLLKGIVISIRELMKQSKPDSTTKDLAAFIALALDGVAKTVERTVAPWEKRDYWVKADKFRREWAWTEEMAPLMRQAALDQDWPTVAVLSAQIGTKLSKIEVSPRHRMGKPWLGAWETLIAESSKNGF